MSRPYISAELQAQVFADAGHRCGYCHADERISGIALSVEHIIPRATDGPTVRENLWRSCRPCMATLYNPRTQPWHDHFRWSEDAAMLVGLTPIGRATIAALQLNRPMLVAARRRWALAGWHPPDDDLESS